MALLRTAYFRRLDIDVWVRRAPTPPAARRAPTAPAPRQRPPGGATDAVARPPAESTAPAPPAAPVPPPAPALPQEFRIRCYRYGQVFVAVGEDAWPRRRFLFGVALALNGFAKAGREEFEFGWPLRGAEPDGGGRAFRAFFRHRTQGLERTLLSGTLLPTLLRHETPAHTCVLGDHLYVAPRAQDATAKRALWRLIQEQR